MEICSFGYLFCSCNVLNAELTKTEIALALKCEFPNATITAVLEEESFWQNWPRRTRSAKSSLRERCYTVNFLSTSFTSFPDVPHCLFYKHHKHWPLLALICLTKIPFKLAANRWMMFFFCTCICLRLLRQRFWNEFPFFKEIWIELYLNWSEECFYASFSIVVPQSCIIGYNMSVALWRRIWEYKMSKIGVCGLLISAVTKSHFCSSAIRIQKSSVMLQLCGHLT